MPGGLHTPNQHQEIPSNSNYGTTHVLWHLPDNCCCAHGHPGISGPATPPGAGSSPGVLALVITTLRMVASCSMARGYLRLTFGQNDQETGYFFRCIEPRLGLARARNRTGHPGLFAKQPVSWALPDSNPLELGHIVVALATFSED